MSVSFCTLFDRGFISKGMALINSIGRVYKSHALYILALDKDTVEFLEKLDDSRIVIVSLFDLEREYQYLNEIKSSRQKGDYYLTLKPHCIDFFLKKYQKIEHLVYVDSDTILFSSLSPVFDELGSKSVLVTPHNFSEEHKNSEIYGIFNGGFILFKNTRQGNSCLSWWRDRCTEWCFDFVDGDKFTDQKYLDKFPILYPDEVVVSKLVALNLAGYNMGNSKIELSGNQILCDGNPLILFHFCSLKKNSFFNFYILSIWDSKIYKNKKLLDLIFGNYLLEVESTRKKYKLPVSNVRNSNRLFTKSMYHQIINLEYIYFLSFKKFRILYLGYVTKLYRNIFHKRGVIKSLS